MKLKGQILMAMGILTLTLGVVLAISAQVFPPYDNLQYVGSDACITCHNADHPEWTTARTIQDPIYEPVATISSFAIDNTTFRTIGEETRPYSTSEIASNMGIKDRQRYIIQTTDGYSILHDEWVNGDIVDESVWLEDCIDCHEVTFNEISVTCEACHGPGSLHVYVAEGLPIEPELGDLELARETINLSLIAECYRQNAPIDFSGVNTDA